jgi:uncharacterized protein YbjT (DUF2867 family)
VRIFVAGATGATGVVLVPLLEARGHEAVPHVRPATAERHALGKHPRACVCALEDADALTRGLAGCVAVVSLIGTMRERFGSGDTYAVSDIGTTRLLVEAARRAGVPRFVLLSSIGAGGAGPYLQAKGEAERIVRESGLAWTLVRPSALVSPQTGGEGSHGRRQTPAWLVMGGGLGAGLPLLGGWVDDVRAILIEVVAEGIARALEEAPAHDGKVLRGRELWALRGTRA